MASPDPAVVERQMYLTLLGIPEDTNLSLNDLKEMTGGGARVDLAANKAGNNYLDSTVSAFINNVASKIYGALAGIFANKSSVPLNAKADFGAKGDGTTDDTTALTAFFAAVVSQGKTGYIPKGRYLGNVQIPVPAQLTGVNIYGDGVGETILLGKTSAPVITVGDGGVLDAQHVTLSEMTIDANSISSTSIRLNHTRFFKLEDAILQGGTSYNVEILGDVANYFAKFERVRFRTAPINVYMNGGTSGIGANSNYFERCHFSGSSNVGYSGLTEGVAVAIDGGDSNVFQDNEFVAAGTAIYIHNSAVGNKVYANQFDGPTTAVNCASAGVQNTRLMFNTGTVNIVDSGSGTMFMGAETASGFSALLYSRDGLVFGGPKMGTGTTPLRVRCVAGLTTDSFRVEKSDGTVLFKVDSVGNIEAGPAGAVTAHAHSQFDNANNGSRSVTIKTGPTSATGNRALVIQAMNAGQTARLLDLLDSAGTSLAGFGPKGQTILPVFTTAARPAAASNAGNVVYDSTLNLPIFSDGTSWKKFDGTVV